MAITLDSTSSGSGSGLTTTWSHTCAAGSSLYVVGYLNQNADRIASVKYNGVAMTRVGIKLFTTGRAAFIYYLANPSTGTNNIVITATLPYFVFFGGSMSLFGTDGIIPSQTGFVDSTGVPPNTNIPTSITTSVDNSWLFMVAITQTGYIPVPSNSGTIGPIGSSNCGFYGGPKTPVGANTLDVQVAATDDWRTFMVAIKPAISATVKNLCLIGVG